MLMASPWVKWKEIVLKYNEAKDEPYELMVWWNTYLGLPYEDEINEDIDPEYLYKIDVFIIKLRFQMMFYS